jgi:hypothetical protein
VSLNTAVAARVGKHRVTYQPNLSGVPDPSGLQLRVDGRLTTLGGDGLNLAGGGRIARTAAPGGIEIAFPDAYTLTVTPGWWASQSKWYLNVGVVRTGAATAVSGASPSTGPGGIAGPIPAGSWLPALPDGSLMGPRPAALHDRYVDLYEKFGEAWRVSGTSSLFDYAPTTSTETFTLKTWPMENGPCLLPETTPVKPVSIAVAQQACIGVRGRARVNCVFDVQVTGERGFARTYLASQRVAHGATRIDLRGERSRYDHTFVATVTGRSAESTRVPTGAVEFTVDGERIGEAVRLDVRGRAAWTAANLPAGRHVVRAGYVPRHGSGFLSSMSDEAHVVISKD